MTGMTNFYETYEYSLNILQIILVEKLPKLLLMTFVLLASNYKKNEKEKIGWSFFRNLKEVPRKKYLPNFLVR